MSEYRKPVNVKNDMGGGVRPAALINGCLRYFSCFHIFRDS